MNDTQIRENLHKKVLRRHHERADTLVVDELGLHHGARRADVAIINGHLFGFEIKSDHDSLSRLEWQVAAYDAVFDRSTVVVGLRHVDKVITMLPEWWGVVMAYSGPSEEVRFKSIRKATKNNSVDPFSIAQLLWRDEAESLLAQRNAPPRILRQPRAILYRELANTLPLAQLCKKVRACLRDRKNWRHPARPSPNDDLCRPTAK